MLSLLYDDDNSDKAGWSTLVSILLFVQKNHEVV